MRFAFLATLACLLLFARHARADHGVFPLYSSVYDEGKKKDVELVRHGSLIRSDYPDGTSRYFILTTAHGGADTHVRVQAGKESVTPILAASDSDSDVAWLELSPKDIERLGLAREALGVVSPDHRSGILINQETWRKIPKASLIDAGYGYSVVVLPDVLGAKSGSVSQFNAKDSSQVKSTAADLQEADSGIGSDPTEGRQITLGGVSPRVSGSPLIRAGTRLEGVAQAFDRHFDDATFSTNQAPLALLARLESGKQGAQSKTRFGYFNGGFYKDYGDGTKDIQPLQKSAGGETSDGGGETSDGGGETSDGGGPRFGSSSGMGDAYRSLGLAPGVLWKGTPAVALRIGGAYLFADRSAIEWARSNGLTELVQPLPPESNLTDLALGKIQSSGSRVLPLAYESFEFPVGSGRGRELDPVIVQFLPGGHIRFRLRFLKPAEDEIRFELDEKGRLLEQTPDGKTVPRDFRPVIEVKGKQSGKSYSVDLRPFYFFASGDPLLNHDKLMNAILGRSQRPYFRIRRRDLPDEYVVDPRWPSSATDSFSQCLAPGG